MAKLKYYSLCMCFWLKKVIEKSITLKLKTSNPLQIG